MKLLVMPADGIKPEIFDAAVNVLRAADGQLEPEVELDHQYVGFASLAKHGTTLRDAVLIKACACDGVVLGTQSHAGLPAARQGRAQRSGGVRVGLDLYANVRPDGRTYHGNLDSLFQCPLQSLQFGSTNYHFTR